MAGIQRTGLLHDLLQEAGKDQPSEIGGVNMAS
jgi:hypothetical protein